MTVHQVAIADLIAADYNPRSWSQKETADLDASLKRFGFVDPILVNTHPKRRNVIVGGHFRVSRWQALGNTTVPAVFVKLTEKQERELNVRLNKNTGSFDMDILRGQFDTRDLVDFGFQVPELIAANFDIPPDLLPIAAPSGREEPPIPPEPRSITTRTGDVWLLGDHRLMCGDSTDAEDVAQLMNGKVATLLHADPPYGMGKESKGVENDNLYGDKLDAFQMAWWKTLRPFLTDNASAYLWGRAPELWRLWYRHLSGTEALTLQNELVWDKKAIAGMASADMLQYPEATERCLFFWIGHHELWINRTQDDFWEGWEPMRVHLCEQRDLMGWAASDVKAIAGNHMYGHWFSRSQWVMINAENYAKLQIAAEGKAFTRPYAELLAEYRRLWEIFRVEVRDPRIATRPYFDNAHDIMRDVWEFPRLYGDERYEHATPKPVAMMERCVVSSSRPGDIVVEPFCGSGPTLIAAQRTGRRCYAMELQPKFTDITVLRWQELTGAQAFHEGTGKPFNALTEERTANA